MRAQRLPQSVAAKIPADVAFMSPSDDGVMERIHRSLYVGLRQVEGFLRDHRIEYWMDAGTLLGARRHSAIIPWDDDIDLAMTLHSFQKVASAVRHGTPEGLIWTSPETDPTQPNFLPGKFRIKGTYAIETGWLTHEGPAPQSLGLSIDLLPLEQIPPGSAWRRLARRFRFENYLRQSFLHGRITSRHRRDTLHSAAVGRMPDAVFQNALKILRAASRDSRTWGYALNAPWDGLQVHADQIWPLTNLRLGDRRIAAPRDPEGYLRRLYGPQFLCLPPTRDRRPHSVMIGFD